MESQLCWLFYTWLGWREWKTATTTGKFDIVTKNNQTNKLEWTKINHLNVTYPNIESWPKSLKKSSKSKNPDDLHKNRKELTRAVHLVECYIYLLLLLLWPLLASSNCLKKSCILKWVLKCSWKFPKPGPSLCGPPFSFSPSWPNWSYFFRFSLLDRTSYAAQ